MRRGPALCVCGAAALLLLLLARLPAPPPLSPLTVALRTDRAETLLATSVEHTGHHTSNTSATAPPASASPPPPPPPPPSANSSSPPSPAAVNSQQDKGKERVMLTREVYVSGHSVVHPSLCPSLGADTRLLVLVSSAPTHRHARDAVRLTWGHFGQRLDVAVAFVLGLQHDPGVAKQLEEEDALYGDLIIGNFEDTYSNLTLKTLSMLEWKNTYCPRAPRFLKTDDDMFINIPKLLQFMDVPSRANATKTIWGKVLKKAYPMRIAKSKYYLSRTQFPGRVLPQFATGPAYLMTADCVPALLGAAWSRAYVRLEDVFVTGVLADSARLRRIHAPEFYNKKVTAHPCAIQRGVAIHMVRYHEQFDLWRKLLDGKTKCS